MIQIYDIILIIGVVGWLGSELCLGFVLLVCKLWLVDMVLIQNLQVYEEVVIFDLGDEVVVMVVVEGVDVIVYFGGVLLECLWDEILNVNICGSYYIYEVVWKYGVKCVVYVFLVYVIGYYWLEDYIDINVLYWFDSLYGLLKCFVEDLGWFYWDKFGIESVVLCIFLFFFEFVDWWMLWLWLSFDDCVCLVMVVLSVLMVGFSLLFGMLDNKVKLVDNGLVGYLGYYL